MTPFRLLAADATAADLPCRTIYPEVFHQREHEDLAKSLCGGCVLHDACRSWAREMREWGTWGGETNDERARAGCPPPGWKFRRRRLTGPAGAALAVVRAKEREGGDG